MTKILAPLSHEIFSWEDAEALAQDAHERIVFVDDMCSFVRIYDVRGDVRSSFFFEVGPGEHAQVRLAYRAHEKDTKAQVRVGVLLGERAEISLDIASFCEVAGGGSDVRVYVVFNQGARATVRVYTFASGKASIVHEEVRGLALGDEARASFIPELSLLHDDIAATHATSVTSIDERRVAYLASHGMPRAEAVQCLAHAFLGGGVNVFM